MLEDPKLKTKPKVKPRAPVYQNFAYQAWKQQQSTEEKEGIVKLPLFPSFGAEEKAHAESPGGSPRKKASDSTLGSNSLRRQIRSYMSSTSVLGFQNKPAAAGHAEYEPLSHREKPVGIASTPTLTPVRRASQQPQDFAAFMGHYKPFIPKSHAQGYSSTNVLGSTTSSGTTSGYYHRPPTTSVSTAALPKLSLPTSAAPTTIGLPATTEAAASSAATSSSMMTAYVYPQTYTPIYIPIIVQPSVHAGSYPYAPGTSSELLTGRIKFFDETQNYGFFTLDSNGSDLFVHYDDLLKSGITKDYIQMAKAMNVRFAFRCVSYYGKYNLSYKAVDIQVLHDQQSGAPSAPPGLSLPK